jgi:hypothetical protein
MTQDGLTSQKKKEAQRTLEREVLHALRVRKQPIKWDVLYTHFERQPGVYSIASVLKELKEGCFIAVDKGQNVTITALGLKRLAAGMF